MSYTPTEWKTGDVITAEKLNNMESGIAGTSGVTVVTFSVDSNDNITSSFTYQEIEAIYKSGGTLIGKLVDDSTNGNLITLLTMCSVINASGYVNYKFDGFQMQGTTTLAFYSVLATPNLGFEFSFTQYALTVNS